MKENSYEFELKANKINKFQNFFFIGKSKAKTKPNNPNISHSYNWEQTLETHQISCDSWANPQFQTLKKINLREVYN